MELSQTIQKIVSSSGKSEEEVSKLIASKTEKFAGLLTESGAAMMVAKELGVELGLDKKKLERLQISQLKDGMNNVEVLGRVKHVFSPRDFEKNGRSGKLCNLIVGDSSGEIRLTVWGKDVEKIQMEKVQRGTALLLKNCYVNSYKEQPQLNLSYNGRFEANPQIGEEELPNFEESNVKLKDLSKGQSDVCVVCRVLRVFPEREFEHESRKGKVANFLIGDETAVVRASAWDSMVEEIKRIQQGEAIKIEGAYTKDGLKGAELQLGYRARILQNPEGSKGLPSAAEMQGIELNEKKVAGLQEGDKFVRLDCELTNVLSGQLRFNVCPKCGKKAESMEGKYVCSECGEVEPDIRAVVSLRLKDETGEVTSILFGKVAEKAMVLDKEELKKKLEVNTAEQVIAELKEKLVGKKVVASGFVKNNSFSGELEFNVKEFCFT